MENSIAVTKTPSLHKRTMRLMGNIFNISIVSDNETFAGHCIDEAVREIQRIEALLTTFREDSQTNMQV